MTSNLVATANKGLPLSDVLIIDSHAHMGPYWNFHIPFSDAAGMIVSMDALGINMSLVCPHLSIGPDFRYGNDLAQRACADFPGRFLGAIGLNPNYPDSIVAEIRRFERSKLMVAIKLHPSLHNYPADGEAYRVAYEEASRRHLPIATHTWHGDKRCAPKMYVDIAKSHPEIPFILIHSGGTIEGIEEAIDAAKQADNIYLETSGSMTFGIVERMVQGIGSERIVFGSDNPFIDPSAQLGKIIYSQISHDAKLDILGRNAKRILGLWSDQPG